MSVPDSVLETIFLVSGTCTGIGDWLDVSETGTGTGVRVCLDVSEILLDVSVPDTISGSEFPEKFCTAV